MDTIIQNKSFVEKREGIWESYGHLRAWAFFEDLYGLHAIFRGPIRIRRDPTFKIFIFNKQVMVAPQNFHSLTSPPFKIFSSHGLSTVLRKNFEWHFALHSNFPCMCKSITVTEIFIAVIFAMKILDVYGHFIVLRKNFDRPHIYKVLVC